MNNTIKTTHKPKPEQLKITLLPHQECLSMSEHHNEALEQTYYSHVISEYGDTRLEHLKRVTVPKEKYWNELPVFEFGRNSFIICLCKIED
jgi:hypothetical protein